MKKKLWICLFLIAIVITTITILGREKQIADKREEPEGIIEVEDTETVKTQEVDVEELIYIYEDFKGAYAIFEGAPYETPINFLLYLDENYYFEGYPESESYVYNISDKMIEENVLYLDWYLPENYLEEESIDRSGSIQLELDYQDDQKSLLFIETDVRLYSVSEEQLLGDKRFQKLPSQIIREREEEDDISLDGYDIYEIDYARIIMMTSVPRIDPEEPIVYVRKHSAGDPIFNVDGSASYPENVTSLSSYSNYFSNHDTYTISYSAHGDGYITIYPQPTKFEIDIEAESDEDFRKLAQQVLDKSETVYVEPSLPHLVADFIERVEFVYE